MKEAGLRLPERKRVVCAFLRSKESSRQMVKIISTCKHFPLGNCKRKQISWYRMFFSLLSCVLRSLGCAEQRWTCGKWARRVKALGAFLTVAHWARRSYWNIQRWNIPSLSPCAGWLALFPVLSCLFSSPPLPLPPHAYPLPPSTLWSWGRTHLSLLFALCFYFLALFACVWVYAFLIWLSDARGSLVSTD